MECINEGAFTDRGKALTPNRVYCFGLGMSQQYWLVTDIINPVEVIDKIYCAAKGFMIKNGKLQKRKQWIHAPTMCKMLSFDDEEEMFPQLRGELLGRDLGLAETIFKSYDQFINEAKVSSVIIKKDDPFNEFVRDICKFEKITGPQVDKLIEDSWKFYTSKVKQNQYLGWRDMTKNLFLLMKKTYGFDDETRVDDETVRVLNERFRKLERILRTRFTQKVYKRLKEIGVEFDTYADTFRVDGALVGKMGFKNGLTIEIEYPQQPIGLLIKNEFGDKLQWYLYSDDNSINDDTLVQTVKGWDGNTLDGFETFLNSPDDMYKFVNTPGNLDHDNTSFGVSPTSGAKRYDVNYIHIQTQRESDNLVKFLRGLRGSTLTSQLGI